MQNACRKCRREGVKLFLKGEKCFSPKCPITKRPYAPGQHGPTAFSKLSEYGKQLREKQKVRKIYNLTETQLKNYYLKANKKTGDTSENLVKFLELRLDSIIYRLGLTSSRSAARQMISHNFFQLNDRNVNIPSIVVSKSDEIQIKDKKKIMAERRQKIPSWLVFDPKSKKITVKTLPTKDELELPYDVNLVIEYYSR